jgi:hypothetical protein
MYDEIFQNIIWSNIFPALDFCEAPLEIQM